MISTSGFDWNKSSPLLGSSVRVGLAFGVRVASLGMRVQLRLAL